MTNLTKQNESHWFDEFVETRIRELPWSRDATDHDKTIVAGNLRSFSTALKERIQQIEAERDAARIVSSKRLQLLKSSGILDETGLLEGYQRPCTCHPEDNPPKPCPRKYALTECRAAAEASPVSSNERSDPTEPTPWRLEHEGKVAKIVASNGVTIMSNPKYYPWCPNAVKSWELIVAAVNAYTSARETRAPQNYHCNICGGDVSFPDGAKPSMSIGPGNKTRLRQTDAPDDGSMKGSSQEIKPDCQPWGFQGPIEIGDRFIWMRGTKHQERVRVTQIATVRGDERRVFTARLDVPGEPVVWNDESRFREACERLSENGKGDGQ